MATDRYEMLRRLSEQQLCAIEALIGGSSLQEAADAAGVNRVTVSRWRNHHPEFQAELNRRRNEIASRTIDRIRHLDELALTNLQERMEAGDDKAIDAWIKARGLGKVSTDRIGPTDSSTIINTIVDERLSKERRRAQDDQVAKSGLAALGGAPSRDEVLDRFFDEALGEGDDECI